MLAEPGCIGDDLNGGGPPTWAAPLGLGLATRIIVVHGCFLALPG